MKQMQNIKPTGSITQGYPSNRAPSSASHQQQPQNQAQMPPMHYQRHRY